MSHDGARRLAAILGLVLAAMGGTAWAQEPEQSFNLTGRILFGYAALSQAPYSESGPAATLETDFNGFWRDPRILQFELKPIVTLGEAPPGTEMGNALTGFSGSGLLLAGSSFPLTLSYSRYSSSLGEESRIGTVTNPNQNVLSGVEGKTTTSVFDAHWMLRFNNWPTVSLDYRDTDYNSVLPQALGAEEEHSLHDFTAHINYNMWGWQLAGRYLHTQYTTTAPDILTGSVQNETGTTSDVGFTASRFLPLHSTLGVNADQTKSDFSFDGTETNLSVRNANATLASQPVQRLSTTLQAVYTSNLQASEEQQILAGAGVPGTSASPIPTSPVPLTYLAAPYHVLNFNGGAAFRLGYGFSLTGNAGESSASNAATSTNWSAGLNYQHKWRSGWLSTNFSHSDYSTELEVVNGSATAGAGNTSQGTATYSPFSQATDLETGAVNLTQDLPRQLRLATSAHVSGGTLTENGSPYPYHDYGGLASLTRPVGQWTLTGSVNLEDTATHEPLAYNQTSSKSVSFGAAYRGLNLSGGYQYGSGLAVQVGSSLIFVNSPPVASPLLGIPVPSTTSGTNLTGSYRSRRGRLMLMGYWYRFNYRTEQVPASEYNLVNLHVSYKLRRLRLIAGYTRQSQVLGVSSAGLYETNLKYFQIERVFRLY